MGCNFYVAVLLASAASIHAQSTKTACEQAAIDVMILTDSSSMNHTSFLLQQHRVLRAIRYIEASTTGRKSRFGLISFQEKANVLVELGSPFSADTKRVSLQLTSLRPRQSNDSATAQALAQAAQQFSQSSLNGSTRIIILAHDGINNDLVDETLRVVSDLNKLNVNVLAISGNSVGDNIALIGYTGSRTAMLAEPEDAPTFRDTIDTITCVGKNTDPKSAAANRKAFAVRTKVQEKIFREGEECGFDRADVVIVLDTSGSVFRVFDDQRKVALDVLQKIPSAAFEKRLRVGIVRFAAFSDVVVDLTERKTKDELLKIVSEIEFTGQNTRIAGAVERAIYMLNSSKRNDAKQLFLLISDGRGEEFWSVVQSTGMRLQNTGAETFAVSAGNDYNEAELSIYAGDASRVFTGWKSAGFASIFSNILRDCSAVGLQDDPITRSATTAAPLSSKIKKVLDVKQEETRKEIRKEELNELPQRTASTEESTTTTPTASTTEKSTTTKVTTAEVTHESTTPSTTSEITTVEPTETTTDKPTETTPETTSPTATTSSSTKNAPSTTSTTNSPSTKQEEIELKDEKIEKVNTVKNTEKGDSESREIDVISKVVKQENEKHLKEMVSTLQSNDDINGSGEEHEEKTAAAVEKHKETKKDFKKAVLVAEEQSLEDVLEGSGEGKPLDTSTVVAEAVTSETLTIKDRELDLIKNAKEECQIDVVFVIDRSHSVDADFRREIQSAIKSMEQVGVEQFSSGRIRVGAVSFAKDARLEFQLQDARRDVVIKMLKRINPSGGTTSTVSGVKKLFEKVLSERRQTAHLVILFLSDGHSQDEWLTLSKMAKKLHEIPNSAVLSHTESDYFSKNELSEWASNSSLMFDNTQTEQFLNSVKEQLATCGKDQINPEKLSETREVAEKEPSPTESPSVATEKLLSEKSGTSAEKATSTAATTTEGKIESASTKEPTKTKPIKAAIKKDISSASENTITTAWPADAPCKVDMMFVIDTSSSVESEFQQQLQFAVSLVKRLPTDDFDSRVRIGTVTFREKAKLRFHMGELTNRSSVLDALLAIEHSGGSTSVASGVNMAVDELRKSRRNDTRQMVVLVSDGNSQDPWEEVLEASKRLQETGADVYAVTVSRKYMFRELELYAGSRWRVYIDGRIAQFLDEAETFAVQCQAPKLAPIALPIESKQEENVCDTDPVDLLIVLDTSSSIENDFQKEKLFAVDLVRALPDYMFKSRISVSVVPFATTVGTVFEFGRAQLKEDILYQIQKILHTGGLTALVKATEAAILQIEKNRRPNARLVVVFVTDGNSQDEWEAVVATSKRLHETKAEIYAVTLSEKYYLDELQQYTGTKKHVYVGNKVDRFIQDVGASVISCENKPKRMIRLSENLDQAVVQHKSSETKSLKLREISSSDRIDLTADEKRPLKRCKYNKIDLEIILDASASREDVFEHQRELALSLIERLPISTESDLIACGVSSFTSVPTLRLPLASGRTKKEIRKSIESIAYRGGSTLTAQAVQLTVDDLQRGRREDAVQVVVLLNDGLSQDHWSKVLTASARLAATNAERFGVALGDQVDLRELKRYIGDEKRIYRDGSTEKFLSDVVAVFQGAAGCHSTLPTSDVTSSELSGCVDDDVDLTVLLDNTKTSEKESNANRYLLLDVLGSIEANGHVRVAIITMGGRPQIQLDYSDISERDRINTKIESLNTAEGECSYAAGISLGLKLIRKRGRKTARKALLIIGDGKTSDPLPVQLKAAQEIRKVPNLSCLAVDTSSHTDAATLSLFTGSDDTVFDNEHSTRFANQLKSIVDESRCINQFPKPLPRLLAAATAVHFKDSVSLDQQEWVYSTPEAPNKRGEPLRDILGEPIDDKVFENQKVVKPKNGLKIAKTSSTTSSSKAQTTILSTSTETTTSASTTASSTTTKISTTRRSTTPATTTPSRAPTTNAFSTVNLTAPTTDIPEETSTLYKPGCLLDLIIVLDSSGSVEETFIREKDLAAGIIDRLRIGPNNARIAIIKFASKEKVRTVYSFDDVQYKSRIQRALKTIPFSSGTTAIHSALLQAIAVYDAERGARPGQARPVAVVFTDGYGQKAAAEEARLLRNLIPDTFAVAINHQFPISRKELELITGDSSKVFTDHNIADFHQVLKEITRDCVLF